MNKVSVKYLSNATKRINAFHAISGKKGKIGNRYLFSGKFLFVRHCPEKVVQRDCFFTYSMSQFGKTLSHSDNFFCPDVPN